jgi:N6-L-threonylcarbamoyladenine synthase
VKILAIETSCDETACALVENGRRVISSVIASQIDIHAATGGVVPEVAAREHVLKIVPVIEEALQKAGIAKTPAGPADIDAIAVTRGPGLLSSLIVGYSAAATLARAWNKPLIPIHHVSGHIYANWLDLPEGEQIQFPVVVLTVSGGHNEIVLLKVDCSFELLGETLDDAAGEAYDKVARLLGLGYPGGPVVAKAAEKGNPKAFDLPRAMLKSGDFNFSFSGLKTAVLQIAEAEHAQVGELSEQFKNDLAASFQECVNDILSEKLLKAAEKHLAGEIHLAGGVSANRNLRQMIENKLARENFKGQFRYAKNLHYCTDNAAMIGAAAYYFFQRNPSRYQINQPILELPDPQLNLYQNQ